MAVRPAEELEHLRQLVRAMNHVILVAGDIENDPLPCEAGCSTATGALDRDVHAETRSSAVVTAQVQIEYRIKAPPPRPVPIARGLRLCIDAPGPLRHATSWSVGRVVATDAISSLYSGPR